MDIQTIQNEIIEEFSVFSDWMDKYEYLIELGKNLGNLDDEFKVDSNLIKGCQSKVWLKTDFKDGKIIFAADSDAIITKGIIALLIRVFSNRSPEEILNSNTDFILKIGLEKNLSPTRSNGLTSMIKQIKIYALAYKTKK